MIFTITNLLKVLCEISVSSSQIDGKQGMMAWSFGSSRQRLGNSYKFP